MTKREMAGWLVVTVMGGLAGYYLGGLYLRRQWERFLEGQ